MSVEIVSWYYRENAKKHPTKLFVFGDNLERVGYGGQAKEMRDEPNAIGIATKKTPFMNKHAFFSDEDYELAEKEFKTKFGLLFKHIDSGFTVVWPEKGIGTDLAKLEEKAPKIWKLLENYRKLLFEYGTVKVAVL